MPVRTATNTSTIAVAAAALGLLAGCYGETVRINRAAAVPPQRPAAASALPMHSDRAVFFGSPTLADSGAPQDASNDDHGLRIPKLNLMGGYRIRKSENLDIALVGDYGSPRWSYRLEQDGLGDTGDYYGGGVAVNVQTGNRHEKLRMTLSGRMLLYSVPFLQEGGSSRDGRAIMPSFAVGVTPVYRVAPGVRIYGGLSFSHQIATEPSDDVFTEVPSDLPDPVVFGSITMTGVAGIEAAISRRVRVSGFVHQTFYAELIDYKPTVGAMFTFDL